MQYYAVSIGRSMWSVFRDLWNLSMLNRGGWFE